MIALQLIAWAVFIVSMILILVCTSRVRTELPQPRPECSFSEPVDLSSDSLADFIADFNWLVSRGIDPDDAAAFINHCNGEQDS